MNLSCKSNCTFGTTEEGDGAAVFGGRPSSRRQLRAEDEIRAQICGGLLTVFSIRFGNQVVIGLTAGAIILCFPFWNLHVESGASW